MSIIRGSIALAGALLPAAGQDQLWITQTGTTDTEYVVALASDGATGTWVLGNQSLDSPTLVYADTWLAHLDGTGNQLSFVTIGTSALDFGEAAIEDGAGGSFLCGTTEGNLGGPNAGKEDAWIARADSSGSLQWMRQLGTSGVDIPKALAPDGSGGAYLCGATEGPLAGPHLGFGDAFVARYDAQGNQVWIRQTGTSANDAGLAVVGDGQGGVFLAGHTLGSLGGAQVGGQDVWIAHYDGAGNHLWSAQYGTANHEVVEAAAPDGSGGFYVCGLTGGSFGAPHAGGTWDAWVGRFDSQGNLSWLRQLGSSGSDQCVALSLVGPNALLAGGFTSGSLAGTSHGATDAWQSLFDSDGNVHWTEQIGTSGDDYLWAAIAVPGGWTVGGGTYASLAAPNQGLTDRWSSRYSGPCTTESYCAASSTSIPGCAAALFATGHASSGSPSGFTIHSGPIPGGNIGVCVFGGQGQANIPLGTLGGMLCVQPPFARTGGKSGGGNVGQCDGDLAFTLADLNAAAPLATPGTVIYAEIWARDPANQDGFLLSDGIQFLVCP